MGPIRCWVREGVNIRPRPRRQLRLRRLRRSRLRHRSGRACISIPGGSNQFQVNFPTLGLSSGQAVSLKNKTERQGWGTLNYYAAMIALSFVRIPADETLGAKTSARNLAAQTIRAVAMEAKGGKPASVAERTRAGTRKPPNRHKAAPPQCDLEYWRSGSQRRRSRSRE